MREGGLDAPGTIVDLFERVDVAVRAIERGRELLGVFHAARRQRYTGAVVECYPPINTSCCYQTVVNIAC